MAELPINADTVNKTINVVDESTKETRKKLDKKAAKGINKLAQLFWASPIGRKTDIYIAERPYKMEIELKKMQAKYNCIPTKYQVEPSSYIALKGANELNYALEEDHLKEMFENLLISDMDFRKKSRVLPAYIEIIKQLSKEDAEFLAILKNKDLISTLPILRITLNTKNSSSFSYISSYAICLQGGQYIEIPELVLDNLLRLQIANIPPNEFSNLHNIYENTFETIKNEPSFLNYSNLPNKYLDFQKQILVFTQFGTNFIDICFS